MEGKQLDFDVPLISVRRFGATPPPAPPPSSSSANAATSANARAEVGSRGAAGERPRRSVLPFYKSELKSGPVRNPGVVPFVWEQSPGRPKDGSFDGDSPARPPNRPVVAPKPPPGRIPRRPPDEKGNQIRADASNSASNSLRRSPISSSTSTHTTTTTTTTTTSTFSSVANGTLSKTSQSSREESKEKVKTKPMVESAAEAPISKEKRSVNDDEDEEEDAFSDALDTLSRTESFFMNCSISGMTGGTGAWEHSGRFSTDPQVRDFMMGRFLPAAQAMATESPQCAPRKPAAAPRRERPRRLLGNGGELRRPAVPLPPQQTPRIVSAYPRITHELDAGNGEGSSDDDDDDGYDDAGHLPMKGCGLLSRFCLKSSFGLLNPVPGLKARDRMPLPTARRRSPQLRASHHGSVGDAGDQHTWEEVYMYKLRRERQAMCEEGSKLTSESNQLSYWSDSQTPEGSSPNRRSTAGGVSPYRNDMPPSPFHEGKGFLGVPKCENRTGEGSAASEPCGKDDGEYWEISPRLNSKQSSRPVSPVVEKTVYVDSVRVLENCDSNVSSLDIKSVTNCMDKNSEIGGESQRIETCPILGVCKDNALPHKVSEVVDAKEVCSLDLSSPLEQRDGIVDSRQNHFFNGQKPLKADEQGKNDNSSFQPLLPPPLPKSPSESWLWRTLPSISSKNHAPQSFLGFQFHNKKQVTQTIATPTDPKWEAMVKTSVVKKGQVRFADALVKPANVD